MLFHIHHPLMMSDTKARMPSRLGPPRPVASSDSASTSTSRDSEQRTQYSNSSLFLAPHAGQRIIFASAKPNNPRDYSTHEEKSTSTILPCFGGNSQPKNEKPQPYGPVSQNQTIFSRASLQKEALKSTLPDRPPNPAREVALKRISFPPLPSNRSLFLHYEPQRSFERGPTPVPYPGAS